MAIRRGKGEGSLYQRKSDGRWVGSFKPEDSSRKSVYGDTRKEAHEKLQKAMRDYQQGKLVANSKQTVRQYLEQWLEQVHHPSIRETTYHEHCILLIPTCVLRDTSKMREVGHRTEAFRIGFQLIESVTYLVNHLIERGKSQIRQVFFAHFFPYMFHRIELWTVGRLSNQSHICWNLELF
jgi:hypothetical protein